MSDIPQDKAYVTRVIRIGNEKEPLAQLLGHPKPDEYAGMVDISELGRAIEETCNHLHSQHYEVISILPVLRGEWDYLEPGQGTGSWGYSLTDGVIITARKCR